MGRALLLDSFFHPPRKRVCLNHKIQHYGLGFRFLRYFSLGTVQRHSKRLIDLSMKSFAYVATHKPATQRTAHNQSPENYLPLQQYDVPTA
jgi:hypothetical protein